jgi:hypothetical protein
MLTMLRGRIRGFAGRIRAESAWAGANPPLADPSGSIQLEPDGPYTESAQGVYLDTLELREAILADDVVLEEDHEGHSFVLHRVDGCRARRVGAFYGAAAAWEALDGIDAPVTGLGLAERELVG